MARCNIGVGSGGGTERDTGCTTGVGAVAGADTGVTVIPSLFKSLAIFSNVGEGERVRDGWLDAGGVVGEMGDVGSIMKN